MEQQLKEIALQLKNLNNKIQKLLDEVHTTKKNLEKINIGSEGDNEKTHSEK